MNIRTSMSEALLRILIFFIPSLRTFPCNLRKSRWHISQADECEHLVKLEREAIEKDTEQFRRVVDLNFEQLEKAENIIL